MKRIMLIALMLFPFSYFVVKAQQTFKPTDPQMLELRSLLNSAQGAEIKLEQAQQKLPEYSAYQKAVDEMNSYAETVKKDQKWPATVQFNPQSLSFFDTAPKDKK